MKMEMSEKDKKLLVFLSIFVIVVCIGYWGIYPNLKSARKISNEIADQEDLKAVNEEKLRMSMDAEVTCDKLEEDILDARNGFFPMMSNDEIDKYFTNLVLDYNLYAYDLGIKLASEESNLKPYQYSEKALELEESGEEVDETEVSEDFADEVVGVYTVEVSLRVGGEEKDLVKLVNDLSNTDQQLRVCNYSWSDEKNVVYGEEEGDYEIVTTRVLNLSLEIYMCEE